METNPLPPRAAAFCERAEGRTICKSISYPPSLILVPNAWYGVAPPANHPRTLLTFPLLLFPFLLPFFSSPPARPPTFPPASRPPPPPSAHEIAGEGGGAHTCEQRRRFTQPPRVGEIIKLTSGIHQPA